MYCQEWLAKKGKCKTSVEPLFPFCMVLQCGIKFDFTEEPKDTFMVNEVILQWRTNLVLHCGTIFPTQKVILYSL